MAQARRHKLPSGFVAIRDILDGKQRRGTIVSTIGVVTDFRAPIQTRGTDWKCQIRIYDQSVNEDDDPLLMNIFWPKEEMPDAGCGDVVVVHSAKVQQFNSDTFSLCTHRRTNVHIYLASKIPKPPSEASAALRPANKTTTWQPNETVSKFVSALYHTIDKSIIPTETEFETMRERSTYVKDRFSELKDVRDGIFVDAVVQIVKEPYDLGDRITLWVSDYTENPSFFHFSFAGGNAAHGQVGDPHGYLTNYSHDQRKAEWTGPFGKKCMQVTCYEPHASALRDHGCFNGSWISLRNLQIKFGRNNSNLEGFLRGASDGQDFRINIMLLNPTEDINTISPQLKNAIRRKRDYEREKKIQLKKIAEATVAGQKRSAETVLESERPAKKESSRARRKASRAKSKQKEAAPVEIPDLNVQVKCENDNKPTSSVADILEPVYHQTTIGGEYVKLQLPFINVNYHTNVQVVDFLPSCLEDFACLKRKASEYDVLSDYERSESESETETSMMEKFTTRRLWEWCFYLQLEDAIAGDGQQKKRFWVLVDNQAAQCLMGLDASDLRQDSKNLETLRQRLFILWGNLEENKALAEQRARPGVHPRPPDYSSDGESRGEKVPRTTNRPFSCCVRQYGVKVPETDTRKADAGDGRRWERTFGLFGTKIAIA